MKRSKLIVFILFIFGALMLGGCGGLSKEQSDQARKYADPIAERMMKALNQDDYAAFSNDFDSKMKSAMSEASFHQTSASIKSKIGSFNSMTFDRAEKSQGMTIAVYKARFSEETSDVTLRFVFNKPEGSGTLSGFWIDSPKMRK